MRSVIVIFLGLILICRWSFIGIFHMILINLVLFSLSMVCILMDSIYILPFFCLFLLETVLIGFLFLFFPWIFNPIAISIVLQNWNRQVQESFCCFLPRLSFIRLPSLPPNMSRNIQPAWLSLRLIPIETLHTQAIDLLISRKGKSRWIYQHLLRIMPIEISFNSQKLLISRFFIFCTKISVCSFMVRKSGRVF